MRRKNFVWIIMFGIVLLFSCKNAVKSIEEAKISSGDKILQQEDGTISLKVDKAACYHDMIDPSSNTAEWNVVVSKSGRYEVWLSSATKDTTDLKYKNTVMLSILDNKFEAHPACDKVVQNSGDVTYPYFRADSFIGSLYIQDTGLYSIQVISEKILPKDYKSNESSGADNTKLLSVFLTPVSR